MSKIVYCQVVFPLGRVELPSHGDDYLAGIIGETLT